MFANYVIIFLKYHTEFYRRRQTNFVYDIIAITDNPIRGQSFRQFAVARGCNICEFTIAYVIDYLQIALNGLFFRYNVINCALNIPVAYGHNEI